MPLVLADRVRETTTTTGTGTISLAGPVSGFQGFSTAIGNANTTYYTIVDAATGAWEVGLGTYTSSGSTLARTTVLSSSNSDALVPFGAGTKDVFVTQPAERAVYVLGAGTGLAAGAAAFTANGVPYASATNTLTTGSALTFDGTILGNALTANATYSELLRLRNNGVGDGTGAKLSFNFSGTERGYVGATYSSGWITDLSGTDATRFLLSGSEQMRLTSTGLGIGTISPAYRLHVLSASGYTSAFRASTAAATGILVGNTAGDTSIQTLASGDSLIGSDAGKYLAFGTNGFVERMRLDSSGNLGIGTSSPGAKLDVVGTAAISGAVTLSAGTANGVAYLNGSKVLTTGSALTFDGTNMSIGGTLDGGKLTLIGTAGFAGTGLSIFENSTGNNARLRLQQDSGVVVYNATYSTGGNAHAWQIGSSEGMRLTSTGLGIGATSPTQKLEVAGSVLLNPTNPAIAFNTLAYQVYKQGTTLRLYANSIDHLTCDGSGNVGIGTSSPSSKLDVNGEVRIYPSSSPAQLRFGVSAVEKGKLAVDTSSNMIFETAGSERMRLDASGNLGIGTSSPGAKLNVQQTASGNFTSLLLSRTTGNTLDEQSIVWQQNDLSNLQAASIAGAVETGTTGSLRFKTNGGSGLTERMRLDSSGNLGLGVTPSAWSLSGLVALQVKNGSLYGYQNEFGAQANTYYNAGWKYITTAPASQYTQTAGQHIWYNAPSGTAGNAISFTQAMTLDASGNLGLGTTSPSSITAGYTTVDIRGASGGGIRTGKSSAESGLWYTDASQGWFGTVSNIPQVFYTNNTERARITSGGYFKASDNGTYVGVADATHEFRQTVNNNALAVSATNASYTSTVFRGIVSRAASTAFDFEYHTANAVLQWQVRGDGNAYNVNGTYGTISDAKMKTDIVDAGSQWADIKAIRFRKFKMKDDPSGLLQLGVVAQELEQTSPGLVDEHTDRDAEGNDLGTTTKSVKTSVLLMKAAVALQEAMARIEKLEAEVATLKGA